MKHTPGPFSFEHDEFIGSLTITAPTDRAEYLCRKVGEASYDEANHGYYVGDLEEAKANMRLFAAAPELLDFAILAIETSDNKTFRRAGKSLVARATGERP